MYNTFTGGILVKIRPAEELLGGMRIGGDLS